MWFLLRLRLTIFCSHSSRHRPRTASSPSVFRSHPHSASSAATSIRQDSKRIPVKNHIWIQTRSKFCVTQFLPLTLCQSGVSSPIIGLRSCSFFFLFASSTWSNCFWAEINNGLELILVNCPGLAAGLLAMMPDVLVGINSWSCKIITKKINNNCGQAAVMFSR